MRARMRHPSLLPQRKKKPGSVHHGRRSLFISKMSVWNFLLWWMKKLTQPRETGDRDYFCRWSKSSGRKNICCLPPVENRLHLLTAIARPIVCHLTGCPTILSKLTVPENRISFTPILFKNDSPVSRVISRLAGLRYTYMSWNSTADFLLCV